jgi:SHAQKYF class myb-like DNA-binding protein
VEEGVSGRWTKEEHERFLEALKIHGKDWKKVQTYVGTRTTTQTRSHAQKYFAKTAKDSQIIESPLPSTAVNSPLCKSDSVQSDESKPIRRRKKRNTKKEESKKPIKLKIIENVLADELSKPTLTSQLRIEAIEQNYIPVYEPVEQIVYQVHQEENSFVQVPEEADFEFDVILPEMIRPLELPTNSLSFQPSPYEESPLSFDFSNINW